MAIDLGAVAPDFTLKDQNGAPFTLSEATAGGRAVLLVFYPAAFSGVCTGELLGFRDRLGEFENDTVTLAAISCDPIFSIRAMADRDALFFPLLSDFWPHGAVASAYGVFDESHGVAKRSSYLVSREGTVVWAMHNDAGVARDLDEHDRAIRALG